MGKWKKNRRDLKIARNQTLGWKGIAVEPLRYERKTVLYTCIGPLAAARVLKRRLQNSTAFYAVGFGAMANCEQVTREEADRAHEAMVCTLKVLESESFAKFIRISEAKFLAGQGFAAKSSTDLIASGELAVYGALEELTDEQAQSEIDKAMDEFEGMIHDMDDEFLMSLVRSGYRTLNEEVAQLLISDKAQAAETASQAPQTQG